MTIATAPQQAPPPLADSLFLLAHDESNGKLRMPESVLGLALASALIGEVALAEKVNLRRDLVVMTDPEPPGDKLAGAVHQRLLRSVAPRPVRDWLLYFADDAINEVAGRLIGAGQLVAHPARVGREAQYEFADPNIGTRIALALCTRVVHRQPLDAATAVLAGLVGATGLEHPSLFEVRDAPEARRHLQDCLHVLHPPTLRALIFATRAAAAGAVATHHP